MKTQIQRLRAEVRSDRDAFEARVREVEELDLASNPDAGDLARSPGLPSPCTTPTARSRQFCRAGRDQIARAVTLLLNASHGPSRAAANAHGQNSEQSTTSTS